MQRQVSRGALVTGAVGGFMFGIAYLVLLVLTSGREASALEGFLWLYGPLSMLAGILMSIGIFASARAMGGVQIASGIFAILAGAGGLATLLVPLLLEFNSASDLAIVMVAAPLGTTLLFGLFAGIGNGKNLRNGRSMGILTASSWLYNLGALASGIALKFGLTERQKVFMAVGALAALLMASATVTHAIGMLRIAAVDALPAPGASGGGAEVAAS